MAIDESVSVGALRHEIDSMRPRVKRYNMPPPPSAGAVVGAFVGSAPWLARPPSVELESSCRSSLEFTM